MSESAWGQLLPLWFGALSAWTFILFGLDKWQAGRNGGRISEATLFWFSALGGWPGGLLGLVMFRHKSAKGSFQLKFAAAFVVWAALLAGALKVAGRFQIGNVGGVLHPDSLARMPSRGIKPLPPNSN